ncbi:MAG: hypothetical protein LBM26_04465 [Methanobrevibacter sp.]|jgi:hypothetical protein|nr:hypothetical protein [Methanobrevibacter sp.]
MNSLIIAILYSLSGFLMKFSDDEYDEKSNKLIAIVIGIACGIICAFLASHNIDAAYIFIAILLGSLLSLKIDGIHHIATLAIFLILIFIWGIPELSIATLAICVISAFIDEIGNDNEYIYKKSNFLKTFFDYRFTMKIAILILAILGIYQSFTGFSIINIDFLSISTFVYFLLFEIFYEIARRLFDYC